MADVFLSYASADRKVAKRLVARLALRGLEVFWDRKTVPGSAWEDELERELDRCTVLVVLLSGASLASEPVRAEIQHAMSKRKSVLPVLIEKVEPPLMLRGRQAADLIGWRGRESEQLSALLNALATALRPELRELVPLQLHPRERVRLAVADGPLTTAAALGSAAALGLLLGPYGQAWPLAAVVGAGSGYLTAWATDDVAAVVRIAKWLLPPLPFLLYLVEPSWSVSLVGTLIIGPPTAAIVSWWRSEKQAQTHQSSDRDESTPDAPEAGDGPAHA